MIFIIIAFSLLFLMSCFFAYIVIYDMYYDKRDIPKVILVILLLLFFWTIATVGIYYSLITN